MNRKRKLIYNTIASLFRQIAGIICGLILPRLILNNYGSDVNGLVSSITQYLNLISIFDAGMGTVIEASLYKPLSEKNIKNINQIMSSAQKFYKTIVKLLFVYVILIALLYPLIVSDKFEYIYTLLLILAISISLFGQYGIGVTNSVLLSANQMGYINSFFIALSVIFNTIISAILINFDASIQMVKFASSMIFLARPIILMIFVKIKYNVNFHEEYSIEPIKQKWNGIAQHIATVIVNNTDVIVLTIFSNLKNVSIYSVYYLVISALNTVIDSLLTGFKALIGDMMAKKEDELVNNTFSKIEIVSHLGIVFLFSVANALIVPFVKIYTKGIDDANYVTPIFAGVLCIAYIMYNLRVPYWNLILSAGHFKQTQKYAIMEAIINVVISVIMVFFCGLVGVAIGTFVAMSYRTIMLANYNAKNILHRKKIKFYILLIIDLFMLVIMYLSTRFVNSFLVENYFDWLKLSIITVLVCAFETLIILLIISIVKRFNRINGENYVN